MSKVIRGKCEVCILLDKDYSTKFVQFCKTCDEFICLKCKYNLYRRGKAALIKNQNEF